jgi:Fur family ferric uptake transcriptional regulator
MRASGYRVTPQRKVILDAICEARSGAPIDEILHRLRTKAPRLNRATVYRNLAFLQRMRLVNSSGTGKARMFEIAGLEPHHHLLCRICGRVTELDRKRINRLKRALLQDCCFEIDDHHLSFSGVCRRCRTGANP